MLLFVLAPDPDQGFVVFFLRVVVLTWLSRLGLLLLLLSVLGVVALLGDELAVVTRLTELRRCLHCHQLASSRLRRRRGRHGEAREANRGSLKGVWNPLGL